MTLAAMTFSSEATYLEQMRNMLQMQQRSAGLILPPEIPTMERYDSQDSQRSSLAKLLHSNANVLSSGSTVTSVIHSVPSHRVFSPDLRMPPALTTYEDGPDPRSKLNGFDDSLPGITVARRFSASLGSGGSSNISPASGSNEHDEQAESPSGKIPSGLIQTTDITGEDSLPPVSPKSESNDSASSERSYTNNNNNPKFQYSHLLQQHLLQRNSSLLQYCLTTPQEPHDRDGGSDAEAEHTSNSPDSSDLQESTTPPPGHDFQCQICDFHSPSKFHYNSHMNTHSVHRCPIQDCNYSTRTEGRLRRHVKGHHQSSRDSSVGDDFKGFGEESPKKSSEGGTPRGSISLQGSGGKAKTYRCKQCDFVALTKAEYFGHARMHIKPEKQLLCPIEGCPFVTEYKHHLEYHSRNHTGSKPFKCPQPNCSYTCVNKSMLNSHMKSHSNFYQYRCDCGYVTKYCHSLKLHLKKYHGHKAINNGPEAAQLTMATSSQPAPTPSPIKVEEKPAKRRRNANKNAPPSQQPAVNHMNGGFSGYTVGGGPSVSMSDGTPVTIPGAFPYGLYPGVGALNQFHAASIYNNLLLNGLMNPGARMNGFGGRANAASPEVKRESPSPSESESHFDPNSANLQELVNRKNNGVLRMLPQSRNIRSLNEVVNNGTPLDLSGGKENGADGRSESPKSDGSSANAASEVLSSRRRRKGPAFKIDAAIRQRLQDPIPEEEDAGFGTDLVNEHQNEKCPIIHPESPPAAFVHATGFRQIGSDSPAPKAGRVSGTVKRPHPDSSGVNAANGTKFPKREFSCEYCAMGFEDSTMYTMHMGFHGRDDPYTCASCGHSAVDRLSFFLHIARAPHA